MVRKSDGTNQGTCNPGQKQLGQQKVINSGVGIVGVLVKSIVFVIWI